MIVTGLSTTVKQQTLPVMGSTLGAEMRRHRESTGLSVRKAAELLGMSTAYLSQLETGKVGLPSADVRRRVAQWLGISHLDVLLLTGEITEDEIQATGKSGIAEPDPKNPAADLCALIQSVNWYGRSDRVQYVRGLIESMIEVDRQYKENV